MDLEDAKQIRREIGQPDILAPEHEALYRLLSSKIIHCTIHETLTAQKSRLPTCPGVYVLYVWEYKGQLLEDRPLYIGLASNFQKRTQLSRCDYFQILPAPDYETAAYWERVLINLLKPVQNEVRYEYLNERLFQITYDLMEKLK